MLRALALLIFLAGPAAAQDPVTVIGDSILAWNRLSGNSVGQGLSRALDRAVDDNAVSGARISGGRRILREIRAQEIEQSGGWVVVDGGANDLLGECRCIRCDGTLAALASRDGRQGEIPVFVDQLLARGHRVVWVGYYGPNGLGGAFDACDDELIELNRRLSRMADRRDGVAFVPIRDLFGPENRGRYFRDNVHPSRSGSAAIAGRVAGVILSRER